MENTKSKLDVGFFFLNLGVLITLITSVTSFLNLVFDTLEKRYPDVLNAAYQYGYSTYAYENIRMALATLIIFFPVFLVISYYWKKYGKEMGALDEVIRRWIMYVILFLSSVVIAIDLVALIKYFVSGEITSRFMWKVVVTLIAALLVGSYYIFELKGKVSKKGLIYSIASALLVIGAIACSFSIMGSPAKQRALRLDDRRVGDLQNIQYQVINYWQQKEKLPASLSDLANPLTGYSLPVDPEGKDYEYSTVGPMTFELCADFSLPMPKGWVEYGHPVPYFAERDIAVSQPAYPGGVNESWNHDAGRTCFERTIDPDIYPPYEKVRP